MASGIKNFSIAMFMVVLFVFGMVMFMIGYLNENNPSSDILNSTEFTLMSSNANNTLNLVSDLANSSSNLLQTDKPTPIFLFLIFESAFTIPKLFLSVLISAITFIPSTIFPAIFGSGSNPLFMVVNTFIAIFIIIAIFLIIRAIRTGDER